MGIKGMMEKKANHQANIIREGVVIKTVPERHVRGVGRCQLKIVSNVFLEKDNK